MELELIYITKDYDKLIELVARNCYQSFDKMSDKSSDMIANIMKKGHLSIASVGNIVFVGVDVKEMLLKAKEINNYIRWRNIDNHMFTISMNILTLMDLYKNKEFRNKYKKLFRFKEIEPWLRICETEKVSFPQKENEYYKKFKEQIEEQVIVLDNDYNELKTIFTKLGFPTLTKEIDSHLETHSTMTVLFKTMRSIVPQTWRHTDMTGGTELSQRYVNLIEAPFISPEPLRKEDLTSDTLAKFNGNEQQTQEYLYYLNEDILDFYEESQMIYKNLYDHLQMLGVKKGRANEIARNILPSNIQTTVIQSRPKRQWEHFFKLRSTPHAQSEIRVLNKEIMDKVGI